MFHPTYNLYDIDPKMLIINLSPYKCFTLIFLPDGDWVFVAVVASAAEAVLG